MEGRTVDRYILGETLGKGVQGKVKLALDRATGEHVALKIISQDALTPDSRAFARLQNENVHWRCEYPRKRGGSESVALLAMEFASQGELFSLLSHTGPLPEPVALALFRQLLLALSACHAAGVYHRDIKPENIVLDASFNLKVVDFGLAALTSLPAEAQPSTAAPPDPTANLRSFVGTQQYMAPEVLANRPYRGDHADAWSACAVGFTMICGFPPFNVASDTDYFFYHIKYDLHHKFWQEHSKRFAYSDECRGP